MLQATIYADRHAATDLVSDFAIERGRRALAGPGFRKLLTMANLAFQRNSAPLCDHLLDDIGLTRADIEALRF